MQAIIALILANLPTIISAGEAGWKFIQSVRSAAQQSGEWTAEQESQFLALLEKETIDPAWQMDKPPVEESPGDQPQGSPEVASVAAVSSHTRADGTMVQTFAKA